ncbi:MAG: FAD-binding oxidoreductase [Deltaproteobacteria bacterium]|nr:FAD-binding oxidoreductase [Deltaproteobacteria bacterium]
MALAPEVYKAFEDIVGTRNISQDIGILETYRCIPAQSSAHYGPFYKHITPRPQAVLLPGSTEEVRNIVRLCNKYKIKFKAAGTFWAAMGYIASDNAVQLDMRRMRKIEIDEKNQTAIIEPYVIGATLQAEAMKVGLNCNIPGVGCSSSVVASTAGWAGGGPSSVAFGSHAENLLGAEWVLPDGGILRTGSIGAGDGWFCGEGPGPSLRALFRGGLGTTGSFGVCTRIAVRLYPWPGPTHLPSEGTIPAYKAVLADNFKCYTLCFPSWKAWTDAVTLVWESDIAYLGHRQFNMFGREVKGTMLRILTDPDKQLCDIPTLLDDPVLKKQTEDMKIEFQLVIAGMTKRDMEYKEKVVDKILEQTEGWKSKMMLEPDLADWSLLYLLRLGHKNLNYVMCGAYEGNFGLTPNMYISTTLMEEAAALKLKWERETTAIAATGGDSEMGSISTIGGGGTSMWEFFTNFDAYEKESIEGTCAFFDDSQKWMLEKGLGRDMGRGNMDCRTIEGYEVSQEYHDSIYGKTPQPLIWQYQWKVREAFNPNYLSDTYYKTLTPK